MDRASDGRKSPKGAAHWRLDLPGRVKRQGASAFYISELR